VLTDIRALADHFLMALLNINTYLYEKVGSPTRDLGLLATSLVLAPAAEHVEPMVPEELGGCSCDNADALVLPARD